MLRRWPPRRLPPSPSLLPLLYCLYCHCCRCLDRPHIPGMRRRHTRHHARGVPAANTRSGSFPAIRKTYNPLSAGHAAPPRGNTVRPTSATVAPPPACAARLCATTKPDAAFRAHAQHRRNLRQRTLDDGIRIRTSAKEIHDATGSGTGSVERGPSRQAGG